MACPIIIRRHEGVQSYLVLDDNPRELLRHVGFAEPFSVRPWLGSVDPEDALEEWAEMLAEDPDNYHDCRRRQSGLLPGTLQIGTTAKCGRHGHSCLGRAGASCPTRPRPFPQTPFTLAHRPHSASRHT